MFKTMHNDEIIYIMPIETLETKLYNTCKKHKYFIVIFLIMIIHYIKNNQSFSLTKYNVVMYNDLTIEKITKFHEKTLNNLLNNKINNMIKLNKTHLDKILLEEKHYQLIKNETNEYFKLLKSQIVIVDKINALQKELNNLTNLEKNNNYNILLIKKNINTLIESKL